MIWLQTIKNLLFPDRAIVQRIYQVEQAYCVELFIANQYINLFSKEKK